MSPASIAGGPLTLYRYALEDLLQKIPISTTKCKKAVRKGWDDCIRSCAPPTQRIEKLLSRLVKNHYSTLFTTSSNKREKAKAKGQKPKS